MTRDNAQRRVDNKTTLLPSRRQMLVGLGVTASGGLAGCSGSASGESDSVDCHSSALAHGDGDILDSGVIASVEDDDVRLAIPLSVQTVTNQRIERLNVFDAAGEEAYVIPVSPDDKSLMAKKSGVGNGQLYYEQYLGQRPFHGRYRIVATDRTGTELDSITIEFNCVPESEE